MEQLDVLLHSVQMIGNGLLYCLEFLNVKI